MSVIDGLQRQEGFTEAERSLADYILKNADEVTRMSISQLAQCAYSSNATAIRLSRKLGASGWRDFRVLLAADLQKRRSDRSVSDAAVPFAQGEGAPEVMGALAALHKDAIDDCYAALDVHEVERAARVMRRARRVYAFANGDSRISTMAFANMAIKLDVNVIVADLYGDALANAYSMAPSDVALVVSYSGKLAEALEMRQVLRLIGERGCPLVWISAAEGPLGTAAGLRLPSREGKAAKIGTFYSQTCMRFALNCVYGALWSLDYEGNATRKSRLDELDLSVALLDL